jgi:hypothetical protein
MTFHSLLEQYIIFLNDLKILKSTGQVDMSDIDFIYPTRLVLLGNLILTNPSISYVMPEDELVERYIRTSFFTPDTTENRSYVPMTRLPSDPKEGKKKLQRVYDIQDNTQAVIGGNDAFSYVVGELVDNMYQHAKFKTGFIVGQKYPTKAFVELCFLDDGITIPKSFAESGQKLEPSEAIVKALNGFSTINQPTRGYGLSTSSRIFTEGLNGEILVISGAGAVDMKKGETQYYTLEPTETLQGTLISIRIPYPSPSLNIYPYIE